MGVPPHALLFPLPSQGHINPMMELAKKLLQEDFFVTFVNTHYTHERIMMTQGSARALESLAHLRFEHIPDGLPPGHSRFNQGPGLRGCADTMAAMTAMPGVFIKLMRRLTTSAADAWPPITCIIADSFFPWVQDVADQFSIPRIALWTTPVHGNLAYQAQSLLEAQGYIPLRGKVNLSEEVKNVPGVAVMPLSDWISFFLVEETTDFLYQCFARLCMTRAQEAAWNLGNNLEELEQDALVTYRQDVPDFLPIGPLLPTDVVCGTVGGSAVDRISMWPESGGCYEWLSQHPAGSVLYISCGSVVSVSERELGDLIQGLEQSGSPFLWAIRPDSNSAPLWDLHLRLEAEKAAGTPSRRALLVPWAPQLNVLTHPAVGAFLSHCGWNSITESICAGVPIVAKPGNFAEQRMNAHYVTEIWKMGVRLPPAAPVADVKTAVSLVLGSSPQALAIRTRVKALRHSAIDGLSPPSGSSYSNWRLFVEDIRKRAASRKTGRVPA